MMSQRDRTIECAVDHYIVFSRRGNKIEADAAYRVALVGYRNRLRERLRWMELMDRLGVDTTCTPE